MENKITVVGLGYVGLTLAITLAKKGFNTIGIEKNKKKYHLIKNSKSHFHEDNIEKQLKNIKKKKTFKVYNNLNRKNDSNIFIITIGTPLNNKKKINLNYIFSICKILKKKIKNNSIIVIRSTVKIGTTKKLENYFNKDNKNKIHLAMCPERTVEGDALKELFKLPQIIGTNSEYAKSELKNIFSKITKNIIFFNTFEEAELLKLTDNAFRDTMFGFANELAKIGEYLNINSYNVIKNISLNYPRSKIAFPGTVGGPCLTKDSHILYESVKNKINIPVVRSARLTNENFPIDLIKKLSLKIKNKKNIKILVLGLSFKGIPETSDTRGSMALPIINQIIKSFKIKKVKTVDNLVSDEDIKYFGNKLKNYKAFVNVKEKFDLMIITNNNKYWKKIGLKVIEKKLNKNGIIFDFWNSFKDYKNDKYFSIGTGKLTKL
ncbi:nucleotide sugar dehydrogenase [Pelagibacterales bacterium SAG-MED14]|nr:nucleotide sugar dehydrogenase [Pelagibacterales bacterium SAG-MED14]